MTVNFTTIATPLILGTASLVAFVSVRDTSIAERIRIIDRDVIDSSTSASRRGNLVEHQLRGLKRRYLAGNQALLLLLMAFVSFVAMATLADVSRQAATAAFGVGAALAAAGFVLVLYEIVVSRGTLFADVAYAEAYYQKSTPEQERESQSEESAPANTEPGHETGGADELQMKEPSTQPAVRSAR